MNREIKYRGFYEGKMYQVGEIRFEAKEVCLWNGKGSTFNFINTSKVELMQFTGFCDRFCREIYEGDIIGDMQEVDGEKVQSKQQVFWNEPTGSWHLDNSFDQDKGCSTELCLELNDFEYKVLGNVYENVELLAQT